MSHSIYTRMTNYLMNISAPAPTHIQEGAAPAPTLSLSGRQPVKMIISIKRKIDLPESTSPQKKRILESYSTGNLSHVVATPMKILRHNTDFTSPTFKRLHREASDVFLKRKADDQFGPFSITRINRYEPCNTKTFIWSLPAEILLAIVALLGAHDLRSLTQLSAFSHFLHSAPQKSIRFITLFWDFDIVTSPILPQIIAFLANIRASGCEELTCMGFCDGVHPSSVNGLARIEGHQGANHLKAFKVSSRLLFFPQLLPFTMQTIHSASLQKLCLSSVKLSSAHWDKLLRYLDIPTLVEFRADADCAPSTLIHFLVRHPSVTNLSILPRPGNSWRTNRVNIRLTLSLSVLDGPLTHILPVLRSHHNPPSLSCLGVSLQADDASPEYITTILQCVDCCDSVSYLMISLPPQNYSHSAMICPPSSHSAVRVKHMAIDYSEALVLGTPAAGDTLALSAAWIRAFPHLKHISLRGYSTATAEDLVNIMRRFAARDVELVVVLQNFPGCTQGYTLALHSAATSQSRVFLCKCARCCDVGSDSIPRNPGGKEVPIAMTSVHTMQGANMASSGREASVLHLARQVQPTVLPHTTDNQASSFEYQPNSTLVDHDDLAAELFSMMLTDHETDPDSHSKLWVSHSEMQQDRGQAYSYLHPTADAGAGLTSDDAQHVARALQVVEMGRQSRAQTTLKIVESRMNRVCARISAATSRDALRTIRDELSMVTTTLSKLKNKVTSILSHRSRLETSCDEIHRLLVIKENELSVSSEPFEFDSSHHYDLPIDHCDEIAQVSLFLAAVSVVIFGIGRRHGQFLMGVLSLILSLAMEGDDDHSESRRQNTLAQIPRSMDTALSRFKLDAQTTPYAVCPACNCIYKPTADLGSSRAQYPTNCTNIPIPEDVPIKTFLYHHFHDYLAGLLSRPDLEALMDKPCDDLLASIGSPPPHIIKDVWDANFFRTFNGPSGQSLFIDRGDEGRYAFTLNVDFFNIEGNLQ
ncbi:hypothetical protein F4604DRAFT_1928132 [Suillus subluteus]|nr:hypothetical protein F4604DRAFT_1928132 [Suillus subluteus]